MKARITNAFAKAKAEGRGAFVAYLTMGFPSIAASEQAVDDVIAAGADIIEFGVPFSDAFADGSVIRSAAYEALKQGVTLDDVIALAKLLKPFAPHLACEMLEKLGADDVWPKWDNALLVEESVEMIVQVNGKLRARIRIPAEDAADKAKLEDYAKKDAKIASMISDKEIIKTIVVPQGKLVNIVVK